MNSKVGWIIGGVVVACGLGMSIAGSIRRKKQDGGASEMLQRLNEMLQPAAAGLPGESAFDTGYAQKMLGQLPGRIPVLSTKAASDFAREIHESWSFWGDDEDRVYGVFRQLRDKIQVSQLAKAYQQNHGRNLIDQLNARLGADEIKIVLGIVRPLPPYRTLNT